jgi:hypothetical protein
MRIAPVGLLASTEAEVMGWSDTVTAITHNHPDGMNSAQAVALAIFWARQKTSAQDIGLRLSERYGYPLHLTPDDIRPTYKRTEKAIDSVPQAISCALHSTSFEDAIRNAISLGGDSDTIAAIAGGIAEALHGIPNDIAAQAWAYLPKDIQAVMNALYQENEHQPMTTLPPELLQAFAETHYTVHHEPPFTLHIGQPCPPLKTLMNEHNALSAAYITAWNPFSRQLNDPENKARQEELKATLKKLGLICIDGIGQHPSNNWPGEVSVLVLGMDLESAKSLARYYEQHAFVWAAGDGTPELVQP